MTERPTRGGPEENGFKKPDRADRHPHNRETAGSEHTTSNFAPNPNDDSHKPKILPWK